MADAALQHAHAVRRAGGVVPAGVDGDDALAADDGERVLVLIAQLVLEALQRLHAAAVKVDLAPLGEVAQKHAGVEHHADGHAEDLAHALGGGRVCGHRAQQRISHVHGEKVGDVLQDDDVAVQIDDLVLLGQHVRGHEAVIGLLRVPLYFAHGAVQVLADLARLYAHVFAREGGQRLHRIPRKPLVEDVDDILVLRGGVFQHRGDGDAAVGHVLVVGGEEDGNAHAIHPFVDRSSREGASVR